MVSNINFSMFKTIEYIYLNALEIFINIIKSIVDTINVVVMLYNLRFFYV